MSEDQVEKTHKVFIAQVSFYAPDAGPMNVIARDEAHARELIPKMVPNFKDVTIHTVVEQTLIQRPRTPDPEEGNAPSSEMAH